MAVGEIARQQLALDLETGEIQPGHGRSVVLNVHLTQAAIEGVGGNVARCGNTRTPVLLDQVRAWCQTAGQITIVPIKDLTAHHHVEAYEIPDRIKTQTELLNHTCVFPHCTRRAETCDHDHIDPWAARRHRAGRPAHTTSRPCADDTTAPRPTAAGATAGSTPPATSGPPRTATASSATTTAPTPRPHPTTAPGPNPDHPAPTPGVPTTTPGASGTSGAGPARRRHHSAERPGEPWICVTRRLRSTAISRSPAPQARRSHTRS